MKKAFCCFLVFLAAASVCYAAVRMDINIERTDFNNGEVIVESLAETGDFNPFQDAGIQPGDKIRRMGGRDVGSPRDFYRAMGDMAPNQAVTIAVERDGVVEDYEVTPVASDFPFLYDIGNMLQDGEKIKLAIAVVGIKNDPASPDPDKTGEWIKETKDFWLNLLYGVFRDIKGNNNYGPATADLEIVDRGISDKAAADSGIKEAGKITAGEADAIKDLTGATHLLALDEIACLEPGGRSSVTTISLIELASGKDVDTVKMYHLYDRDSGELVVKTVGGYKMPLPRK